MKTTICQISLIVSAVLSSGCSSKQELEGEAFIDSGSGATKLALVNIQVVPEEKFIAHIKSQLPKADEEAKRLTASIERHLESEAKAQALIAQSAGLAMAASFIGGNATVSSQNASAVRGLEAALATSRDDALISKQKLRGLATGENPLFFAGKIEGATLSVETNSDGKFKVSMDKDKRTVLVATKDDLAWALWLSPDKAKSTISLTNRNLSGSGCVDCVFGEKVTPKSITSSP